MREIFSDVRGIVVLDTLGNYFQLIGDINKQGTGLEVLQTVSVGCENITQVIQKAIEKNKKIKLNS